MPAVTQRIQNYLGGLSKQPDVKKLPGQLRTAQNVYPDITTGVAKRPGTELIKLLGTGSLYNGGRWFYIHRDDDEYYVGQIKGGDIKIWNAVSGVACTVNITTGTSGYINTAKDNLSVLTVQDTTFITNSSQVVAAQAAPASSTVTQATIRLLGVEYSAKYYVKIIHSATTYELDASHRTTPAGTSGDDYITRNADGSIGSADPPKQILSAEEILTDIESAINGWAISGMTVTRLDETIELSCTTSFTIEGFGGQANDALEVFTNEVDNISDLPAQSREGRTVKVSNSATAAEDSYWAEFVLADNSVGTTGKGFWQETVDPTVSPGLDASTMPHELVNTALNTFTFQEVAWTDRLVGDDVTNPQPSFVGSTIQKTFFYNNRLGFLTEDNVSMSQAGEYFNFYFISALTATAADPIDISASSIQPAVLHGVIPTAQGLVIFSQYQQFLLFSDAGNITPTNVQIRGISNYENDRFTSPVELKDTIIFAQRSPNFSQVYAMRTQGENEQPIVADIGRIVSRAVPNTTTDLTASSSNSVFALYGPTLRDVYLFRTFDDGNETLFQAWFTWKMPGTVEFIVIDEDVAYAVTLQGDTNEATLVSMSLNQDPEDNFLTKTDGMQVNAFMDLYSPATSVAYDSSGDFTKAYIPWGDSSSTLTPLVLIAGDATGGDDDVGFYTEPTIDTDGGGTYFKIPNRDFSSIASDVLVGWAYDMELELPTTYFRLDESGSADFTASLIISRYKFSVSESGAVEFRTRPTGESRWDTIIPVIEADFALANDVPVIESKVMAIPIHQRNTNFEFSVYSDTPFPVGIDGMFWEGQYSPRYYRRS